MDVLCASAFRTFQFLKNIKTLSLRTVGKPLWLKLIMVCKFKNRTTVTYIRCQKKKAHYMNCAVIHVSASCMNQYVFVAKIMTIVIACVSMVLLLQSPCIMIEVLYDVRFCCCHSKTEKKQNLKFQAYGSSLYPLLLGKIIKFSRCFYSDYAIENVQIELYKNSISLCFNGQLSRYLMLTALR